MGSPEGSKSGMSDEKLEAIIGNLLRVGVLVSATIVGVAGLFYLIQHQADSVNYTNFHMERGNLRMLSGIFWSAMRLRTDAMIQLGYIPRSLVHRNSLRS